MDHRQRFPLTDRDREFEALDRENAALDSRNEKFDRSFARFVAAFIIIAIAAAAIYSAVV